MLQYGRIDACEGIKIDKTDASKECANCHYWYFKDAGYKFEPHVCSGFDNILMMRYGLKNVTILNVKCVDYRFGVTKNEAINILCNSKLDDKGTL